MKIVDLERGGEYAVRHGSGDPLRARVIGWTSHEVEVEFVDFDSRQTVRPQTILSVWHGGPPTRRMREIDRVDRPQKGHALASALADACKVLGFEVKPDMGWGGVVRLTMTPQVADALTDYLVHRAEFGDRK